MMIAHNYSAILMYLLTSALSFQLYAQEEPQINTSELINYAFNTLDKKGEYRSDSDWILHTQISESQVLVCRFIWAGHTDALLYEDEEGSNYVELEIPLQDIEHIKIESTDHGRLQKIYLTCDDGFNQCVNRTYQGVSEEFQIGTIGDPYSVYENTRFPIFTLQTKEAATLIHEILQYESGLASTLEAADFKYQGRRIEEGRESRSNRVFPLFNNGGVYHLNIDIASLDLSAILDSGASDVNIPPILEQYLLENKVISRADYLPDASYQIADGTIVEQRRFILPTITLGGIAVHSVPVTVGSSDEIFLLGRSFLDKFLSWKIDNLNQTLTIEY